MKINKSNLKHQEFIDILKNDPFLFMKEWNHFFYKSEILELNTINKIIQVEAQEKQEKEVILNNFYTEILSHRLNEKEKFAIFKSLSDIQFYEISLNWQTIACFYKKFKEYHSHEEAQIIFLSLQPDEFKGITEKFKKLYLKIAIGSCTIYEKALINRKWDLVNNILEYSDNRNLKDLFKKTEDIFDCRFDFDIDKYQQHKFYDFYSKLFAFGYKSPSAIVQMIKYKFKKNMLDPEIKLKLINLIFDKNLSLTDKKQQYYFKEILSLFFENKDNSEDSNSNGNYYLLNKLVQHPKIFGLLMDYFLTDSVMFSEYSIDDICFNLLLSKFEETHKAEKIIQDFKKIKKRLNNHLKQNPYSLDYEQVLNFKNKILKLDEKLECLKLIE